MNKELLDKVVSLYTEIGNIDENIKMLEANKADLLTQLNEYETLVNFVKNSTDLGWAKWVATDYNGDIYAYSDAPIKVDGGWWPTDGRYENIPHEQALSICGRIPQWDDEEPIQVVNR